MHNIEELPRDIVFRIISFDPCLAITVYTLNKRLHSIFCLDPNFNELVKLKFYTLIDWNIRNALSVSDVMSIERNPMIIANTLPQVKMLVDVAVGDQFYSLNKYLSLLLKFGTSINRQVALLQHKTTKAVNQVYFMTHNILETQYKLSNDEYHEFISMWYGLENRTEVMYNRMKYWMKYQIEMERTIKSTKDCTKEWKNKLKWVLEKDAEYQAQFDSYFTGDTSFDDMIAFFTTNIANQQLLFESSFIRWTATEVQRQDMISNLETIMDITRLAKSFHDAFARMFQVLQSMKDMINTLLQTDGLCKVLVTDPLTK